MFPPDPHLALLQLPDVVELEPIQSAPPDREFIEHLKNVSEEQDLIRRLETRLAESKGR